MDICQTCIPMTCIVLMVYQAMGVPTVYQALNKGVCGQ